MSRRSRAESEEAFSLFPFLAVLLCTMGTLALVFVLIAQKTSSDEQTQAADNAEIGAALRMAHLLLFVAANGALLQKGEAALFVSLDEDGARYRVVDAKGATLDEGDDWSGLTARLEAALPRDVETVSIIWP